MSRTTIQGSCGGKRGGGDGNLFTAPLLSFLPSGGGTFTRASEGSYLTQPPTSDGVTPFIAWAANNVIREDKRDGVSGGYLFEKAVTQLCFYSEDLNQASWIKGGGTTIAATTDIAPDGDADCCRVSFGAADTDSISRPVANTVNNNIYPFSVWVRKPAGPGNVRLRIIDRAGVTTTTVNQPVGTTWTRLFQSINWGTGAVVPEVYVLNDSGGGAQEVQLWGVNVTLGVVQTIGIQPVSVIRTPGAATATTASDKLTFPTTPLPMRAGKFSFRHSPQASSTTHSADQATYSYENSGFTNCINMRPVAPGFNVRKAGVAAVARWLAITYSANQIMTSTVDLANGSYEVAGATTGNGTGYSNPTSYADGLLEVGGTTGGGWANARIWEPFYQSVIEWVKAVDFTTGTYTRTGEASYYNAPPNTSGGFLSWAAANVLREDKRDGTSGLYLFENTRINIAFYSEDLSNAAWVKTGCSISGTTAPAPDGDADCCTVSFTASATDNIEQAIAGTLNATAYVGSVWVRKPSGAGNIRLRMTGRDAAVTTTVDIAVSATWKRIDQYVANWGTGASTPLFALLNDVAGTAQDLEVWGFQMERITGSNPVPSSNLRTAGATATRGVDVLTYASCPVSMATGAYRVQSRPVYTNAEALLLGPAFGFNSPDDTYEAAYAAGTCTTALAGVPKFVKTAITYARDQAMTITVDNANNILSVLGAASGSGPGAVGAAMILGTAYLRVGANPGGSRVAFCRIGEPYVPA